MPSDRYRAIRAEVVSKMAASIAGDEGAAAGGIHRHKAEIIVARLEEIMRDSAEGRSTSSSSTTSHETK